MSDIAKTIEEIRRALGRADEALEPYCYTESDEGRRHCQDIIEYNVERAFVQLLFLLESMQLPRTYDQVELLHDEARSDGYVKVIVSEFGDPFNLWNERIGHYVRSIAVANNIDSPTTTVSKDIVSILRATVYSINDRTVFPAPPTSEAEVHSRIEAVLKCVFPDLKHKPTLSKPIKNFEPDTGLPSIKTLIEYKYISTRADAKRVADEVLADTRAYISKDWENFVYVIYETHRLRAESEWMHLLHECGVDDSTQVIVLSGEPPTTKPITRRGSKRLQP